MTELRNLRFNTKMLRPHLVYHEVVESTNEVAKELVMKGHGEGTLVIAGRQTHGQGRQGRFWESPSGGLYMSIIIEPKLPTEVLPLLNLLMSCAVADTVGGMGVKDISVKWPNDILISGRKVGGILGEVVGYDERFLVILGVGVNLNTTLQDYSPDLQPTLTSMKDVLERAIPLRGFVTSLVEAIDIRLLRVYAGQSFIAVLEEWRRVSSTLGQTVRVHDGERVVEGLAVDVSATGSLLVESETGITIEVAAGDVIHLEQRSDHQ